MTLKNSVHSRRKRRAYLSLIVGFILAADVSSASARFLCEFDGYEKSGTFFEVMQSARSAYEVRFGLGHFGNKDVHERLRAQIASLNVDLSRTPLVSADFENGQLDVFYCASEKCTRDEIESQSLRTCMEKLDAKSCRTYAIKIDRMLVCTVMPSLKDG